MDLGPSEAWANEARGKRLEDEGPGPSESPRPLSYIHYHAKVSSEIFRGLESRPRRCGRRGGTVNILFCERGNWRQGEFSLFIEGVFNPFR